MKTGIRKIRDILGDIQEQGLIYPDGQIIVYQTLIERRYPGIDIHLLCDILNDYNFDWNTATSEYLKRIGEKAL